MATARFHLDHSFLVRYCYGSCTALYTLLPSVSAQDLEAAKIVGFLHCPQIAISIARWGLTMPWCKHNNLRMERPSILLIRLQSSHLAFTIPPAIILTVILRPLLTRLDLYKIWFLITVSICFCLSAHSLILYNLGCCDIYHSLGRIFDIRQSMDLSAKCHSWSNAVAHSRRGAVLLRYSNVHHILTVHTCE